MFKGCHFPKSIILTSVRWYLRYKLSYRDIEELMAERGVRVDHATINRWVVKFSPLPTAGSPKGLTITPILRRRAETQLECPIPAE